MCGIFGIVSKREKGDNHIANDIIDGIIRLEYRGYDSAGIALINDNKYYIEKCVGAPSEKLNRNKIKKDLQYSNIAMSHTRWATHGEPSIINAHPHIDINGKICVVHNGVILNYDKLKEELEQNGYKLKSQTDTEIIPNLIDFYINKNNAKNEKMIINSIIESINRLEGNFGLLISHIDIKDTLLVFKNGSPILIGQDKDNIFISSDLPSFLPWTKKYIILEDGEMAIISNKNKKIEMIIIDYIKYSSNNKLVSKTKKANNIDNLNIDMIDKCGYDTFTLKEIYEGPIVAKNSLAGRLKNNNIILGGLINYTDNLIKTKTINIIGIGTAYNAGFVSKYLIEKYLNIKCEVNLACETRDIFNPNLNNKNDINIFISQSGETADSIDALNIYKNHKRKTFGIINVVGSTIARGVDTGIYTRAGVEIGVASTKAFISQLISLYLLVFYIGIKRGILKNKNKKDILSELDSIPTKMLKTLDNIKLDYIKKICKDLSKRKTIIFLSTKNNYPIAKEISLKYKELTYNNCESYHLGELKHGPIAIVDKNVLAVIILVGDKDDKVFKQAINSTEQIFSKGGEVIIITNKENKNHPIVKKCKYAIYIENTVEDFYPLLTIIPGQLLSYWTAKELKRNIDKPRNLAKSVTVK